MIKAIFFATFDVNEGPKLHYHLPAPLPSTPSLFDFRAFAPLIIPPPALCNTSLNIVTPRIRPYHDAHRILSYPVCIESEYYPRNAFTFNFGLVLEADTEFSSYLPVVKKLVTLFRSLEEQSRFLSKDIASFTLGEDTENEADSLESNKSRVYALCEILLEDLNNYGETQIPIDEANTLNIKLFPTYPPPPPLYAWQVPLITVPIDTLTGPGGGGDLTMTRILPYINGINSVKRISLLADADLKLVRKAIRHLLYYGCCILLDIFSFSAIYAPTSSISSFVEDEAMQAECARYVTLPGKSITKSPTTANTHLSHLHPPSYLHPSSSLSTTDPQTQNQASSSPDSPIAPSTLLSLYTSLSQSTPLRPWVLDLDPSLVERLDIRRLITFGVIKGFLYRVHRYAIATSSPAFARPRVNRKGGGRGITSSSSGVRGGRVDQGNTGQSLLEPQQQQDKKEKIPIIQKGKGIDKVDAADEDDNHDNDNENIDENARLEQYLDGTHCFDEICTDLGISERELFVRLKAFGGDVVIVNR